MTAHGQHKGPVILIGGAPTTGKSTMAKLLAKRLNLPWISTDQVRELMRSTVRKEDYPALFNADGYTAERYLTEFSLETIVQMEFDQGAATWAGVKSLIEEDYTWRDGFIVEGVNILPELVAKDFTGWNGVHAVFLADEDADRTRDVVFSRGLWADARMYSDDVKEKEVAWAMLFSTRIKHEASRYGYPCIEVQKCDDDVDAVLKVLDL